MGLNAARKAWSGALLLAVQQSPGLFAQDAEAQPPREAEAVQPEYMIVTARKREETVTSVPGSITSFSEQSLTDFDIVSLPDYATKTPNLSFAYGNGSTAGDPATAVGTARTIAIRGVAGARTTGFYLDDTSIPNTVDLRVLDLAGIEVLKGPQGTLYGDGSLGGNIRLISKPPHLLRSDLRYILGAGQTQGGGEPLNSTGEAVGNLVLSEGVAALRLAAFFDDSAGYLTRTFLSDINDPQSPRIKVDNQGAANSRGGSISALWRVSQDLDLGLRLLHQSAHHNGYPAAYAPLPAFKPTKTIDHTADIQPVVDDTINMPSVSFTWRGGSWNLISTTGYFSRDTRDVEDSTEGTAQYWETKIPQGFAWTAHHETRQISHETRLAFSPPDSNLRGTIGFFHARSRSVFSIDRIEGLLGDAPGTKSLLWEQMSETTRHDNAVFTELDYTFAETWTLTLGDRSYWLDQSNDLTFDITSTHFASDNNNKDSGHTPKIALSYQPSGQAQVYASGSQGFRAGGAQLDPTGFGCEPSLDEIGQTAESITKIKADTVTSIELGGRIDFPNPGLLLSGSLFRIDWDRIQQPLFLASCGFYLQGNAGAARINGGELELAGHVTPTWKIRAGAGYQDARITEQGLTGQPVGSRVYQTPKWNGTLGNVYSRRIDETWTAFGSADYSYTGDSISANAAPGINLKRQAYALVNTRAGVGWAKSELALNVHNAGNSRPNLGDIGYIGYTRWVDPPANTVPLPQVVTLPPRSFMLQYRQSF